MTYAKIVAPLNAMHCTDGFNAEIYSSNRGHGQGCEIRQLSNIMVIVRLDLNPPNTLRLLFRTS